MHILPKSVVIDPHSAFANSGIDQSSSTIKELPEEILLYIFSFLRGEDLGRASRVCRQWRRICRDTPVWKEGYALYKKACEKGGFTIDKKNSTIQWTRLPSFDRLEFVRNTFMNNPAIPSGSFFYQISESGSTVSHSMVFKGYEGKSGIFTVYCREEIPEEKLAEVFFSRIKGGVDGDIIEGGQMDPKELCRMIIEGSIKGDFPRRYRKFDIHF